MSSHGKRRISAYVRVVVLGRPKVYCLLGLKTRLFRAGRVQLVSSQVLPQLQTLQAQHAAQQELIQSLVKQVVGGTGSASGPRSPKEAERKPYDSWNEHELLTAMRDLQGRMTALLEENHQLKRRNKDLEHKLNSATASK